MDNFDVLIRDEELNSIIDSINEKNKEYLKACHGRYHTMFVVNNVEYILRELEYDEHIIELGKIAALLHDIGTLTGKRDHALKGSEMCDYFLDKTRLTGFDKKRIRQAIRDHSNGEDIDTPFGAILLLVDKVDLAKDRVLSLGEEDEWHLNLRGIDNTEIAVEEEKIIINYITNKKFSKDIFNGAWHKGRTLPKRACRFLDLECVFQINGKENDIKPKK